MSCVVCNGRGPCEFCPARLEVLAEVNEERTPANLTIFDQEHAGAIEKLRGAHTFIVAYVGDDGIGVVAANCRQAIWMRAVAGLARQAADQYDEDEAAEAA